MLIQLLKYCSELFFFIGSLKNSSFLKPLSESEEHKCLLLHAKGDKEARAKLIEHNLRLVAHIVKKYDIRKETQDLISIGTIGLIKGIDSFKLEKGKKLTTYISRCIENEILMYLRNNKNYFNVISLDASISSDQNNPSSLLDTISNEEEIDIPATLLLNENKQKLLQCLSVLDEKERFVIEHRYGIHQDREYKQKEVAKQLNISRSYVSRIEKKALFKLYKSFINK